MSASVDELLQAYCAAIDARRDPVDVAARYWTADGVLDNTAIGSPLVEGKAALTENFAQMFATMEMLEHRISDLQVVRADGVSAQALCQVAAAGRPWGSEEFRMSGEYQIEARSTDSGWKLSRLAFTLLG